jgi:hypothetical protein
LFQMYDDILVRSMSSFFKKRLSLPPFLEAMICSDGQLTSLSSTDLKDSLLKRALNGRQLP